MRDPKDRPQTAGAVLRFPSEPARFHEHRQAALRWFIERCRRPTLREFDAWTEDLGAFIAQCHACGGTTLRLGDFDAIDDADLTRLKADLMARAEDPARGWRPSQCADCGAPDPSPLAAFYARYLPEIHSDLLLELIQGEGRVLRCDVYTVGLEGAPQRRFDVEDEAQLFEAIGAPFSLRGLWRRFIDRHHLDEALPFLKVQEGYYLGLRPYAETEVAADALFAQFEPWLEPRIGPERLDVITFLRDAEAQGVRIGEGEGYRAWLSSYAEDISDGALDPFLILNSGQLLSALGRLAARYGVRVEPSTREGVWAWLASGELRVEANLTGLLFQIVHEGRGLYEGLRRGFKRELLAVVEAAGLPAVLRAQLPDHEITIHDGHILEARRLDAARGARADLVELATSHDYHTAEGLAALLERLR
ncbi:hypothetical protein KKF91_00560 [Myxococcota bacterium]|nr:hypothetical protein [Myxococcota bacterium]MBU1429025.1 hypothetical protein [Myxococcota bacterium]MBU1898763.1 hypothetical protein [Myxococcota bacterium]